MIEDSIRLCTLYVYHSNERRLLYVSEEAGFPARQFNQDDWRLVIQGVEPPPSGEASLTRFAYYPSLLPKKLTRSY